MEVPLVGSDLTRYNNRATEVNGACWTIPKQAWSSKTVVPNHQATEAAEFRKGMRPHTHTPALHQLSLCGAPRCNSFVTETTRGGWGVRAHRCAPEKSFRALSLDRGHQRKNTSRLRRGKGWGSQL